MLEAVPLQLNYLMKLKKKINELNKPLLPDGLKS